MMTSMNKTIKQLAIIGPTASGKSGLAVTIAKQIDAFILSLDSLSLYKEIDIVSAKPTRQEQEDIVHYGINVIYPDKPFNVTLFAKLYREAYRSAEEEGKNLIIVGGTSFYLKSLIDGISPLPPKERAVTKKADEAILEISEVYQMLSHLDPHYMARIASNDSYRIQKALEIFYATGEIPSVYFRNHPPVPTILGKLPLYRIVTERPLLRNRINQRTAEMLQNGLIDEVAYLERKYSRTPHCMKAIGIKETLMYLDGLYDRNTLEEKISTNTARLAKRQTTFNQSQFENHLSSDLESLEKRILKEIEI